MNTQFNKKRLWSAVILLAIAGTALSSCGESGSRDDELGNSLDFRDIRWIYPVDSRTGRKTTDFPIDGQLEFVLPEASGETQSICYSLNAESGLFIVDKDDPSFKIQIVKALAIPTNRGCKYAALIGQQGNGRKLSTYSDYIAGYDETAAGSFQNILANGVEFSTTNRTLGKVLITGTSGFRRPQVANVDTEALPTDEQGRIKLSGEKLAQLASGLGSVIVNGIVGGITGVGAIKADGTKYGMFEVNKNLNADYVNEGTIAVVRILPGAGRPILEQVNGVDISLRDNNPRAVVVKIPNGLTSGLFSGANAGKTTIPAALIVTTNMQAATGARLPQTYVLGFNITR